MISKQVNKVGVIGAGNMGAQIAEVFANAAKCSVWLHDLDEELVNKGLNGIRNSLKRRVDKGKITQDQMDEIIGRIHTTTSLTEVVKNTDFVVEAIIENMEAKKSLFKQLDQNANPDMILATNTSGLSITEMAGATNRPEKVVGMHFFNPVRIMVLVEVVKGSLTSDETVETTCDLAKRMGKETVVCRDIGYGFLANRPYMAMIGEAVEMVWERVAPPAEIDKAVKLGYNLPMGPLELADMLGGWANAVTSEQDKIKELGPIKGYLHPLIRQMIRAGYTGGMGKKGIYDYWKDVLSKG
jgi:3-hydroxybutyryl-CoA dehydrogenase